MIPSGHGRRAPRHGALPLLSVLCLAACPAPAPQGPAGAAVPRGGDVTAAAIARSSTLEAIQKRGELRVGMEAGYFPFEMKDAKGELTGFDVEIARHMAETLGVKLTLVNTDWDGIIPSLLAEKFDIIMSGMTRTPKRAMAVAFADPYFETGQVLVVNKEKGASIVDYRSLDSPEKVVAVKQGTTGDIAAGKLMPRATIRKYQTEADAAMEVNFGRADAFVYDEPFSRIWVKRHEAQVRLVEKPFTTEHLAWAVRKGDPDLVAWLNVYLADIKADDPVESTYDRLYRKYFVDMSWQSEVPEPPAP